MNTSRSEYRPTHHRGYSLTEEDKGHEWLVRAFDPGGRYVGCGLSEDREQAYHNCTEYLDTLPRPWTTTN